MKFSIFSSGQAAVPYVELREVTRAHDADVGPAWTRSGSLDHLPESQVVQQSLLADGFRDTGANRRVSVDQLRQWNPVGQDETLSPVDPAAVAPAPFNSRATHVSMALVGIYAALNAAMAVTQKDNPVAALPMIYNLTGYLPKLLGDMLNRYHENQALKLDATMYTKILGAGVIEGLMLAASRYPEAMGLRRESKLRYVVNLLGWSGLAALLVDVASHAISRHTNGVGLVYFDSSPEAWNDPSRYLCSVDYIVAQIILLIREQPGKRQPAAMSDGDMV